MPKKLKINKRKKSVGVYSLSAVTKTAEVKDELLNCIICNCKLSNERLEALRSLNAPKTRWTCVKDSTVGKVLGQYSGEVGTSSLFICDRIDNDSVRAMFRKTPAELVDSEVTEKDTDGD